MRNHFSQQPRLRSCRKVGSLPATLLSITGHQLFHRDSRGTCTFTSTADQATFQTIVDRIADPGTILDHRTKGGDSPPGRLRFPACGQIGGAFWKTQTTVNTILERWNFAERTLHLRSPCQFRFFCGSQFIRNFRVRTSLGSAATRGIPERFCA